MNKKQLHHLWTKIRILKPRYFFAMFLVSATVCVFALRHNNQTMINLKNNVFAADQAGGDVDTALKNLQAYVTAHMNTNLTTGNTSVYPPIQLKYTYDRLQQAAAQQAQQIVAANQKLYTDAQTYCQGQLPTGVSFYRVPCVEQYVSSHGLKATANITIPANLYEFSFTSPTWSPDLAGWSLVISTLSLLCGTATFIVDRWFKDRIR